MTALFALPSSFDPTDLFGVLRLITETRPALDVRIEGPPQGKGRPRFDSRSGRAYSPPKTERWERRAAAECLVAWGRGVPPVPVDEPVVVVVDLVINRPKRLLPTARKPAPQGRLPSTAKPDVDNAGKIVLDAMSARRRKRVIEALVSSVLIDDRCVVVLLGVKAYAALHETEHTRIRLWRPCLTR